MKIHLATDHAGLELKNIIKEHLKENGHDVTDHGAHEYDALDDYPDFIFPCAKSVAADPESRGIILGGSGQGEAMTANRIKGVRAAVFYNGPEEIVKLSREHNNANVIAFGGRMIGIETARDCLNIFLNTEFEGGRHERRVDKLSNPT